MSQRHRRHADPDRARLDIRHPDRDPERRLHVGVPGSRSASAVRFAADTLNGVPSIVIGVFVYGIAVLPFKQFSALAGGLALGIMMIPIIARTTEELLLLVPSTMREGALALGATRARAVFTVVLPAAAPGIITGVVLALARIAGETAPLLFTAFGNQFFTTSLTQPIASLTVQVYTYAISPYEDWHRQAWAGALVLVIDRAAVFNLRAPRDATARGHGAGSGRTSGQRIRGDQAATGIGRRRASRLKPVEVQELRSRSASVCGN